MSFEELEQLMYDYNEKGIKAKAKIVYSNSTLSWSRHDFSLEERTYITENTTWGWDRSKMGHCRIGEALAGPDAGGIRLDYHPDWIVESCCIIEVDGKEVSNA